MMNIHRMLACRALIPVLLLGVSACSLFQQKAGLDVTPVQTALSAVVSPDDAYYEAAVRAISVRDYGRALDYLQEARQKQRDDIRVLNAFGVVYDKLGRFDLSARYYDEAKKLDPASSIVAANQAYSVRLQERAVGSSIPSEIAVARPPVVPMPKAGETRIAPPGIAALATGQQSGSRETAAPIKKFSPVRVIIERARTATALARPMLPRFSGQPPAKPVAAPLQPVKSTRTIDAPEFTRIVTLTKKARLIGRPLAIVNASGRTGASEPVRQHLASHGWTAPRSALTDGAQQSVTTIGFASANSVVAHALARTLPFPSRLESCESRCAGVRLVLGRDYLKSRLVNLAAPALKRS